MVVQMVELMEDYQTPIPPEYIAEFNVSETRPLSISSSWLMSELWGFTTHRLCREPSSCWKGIMEIGKTFAENLPG